jgi:hypothetical protein
MRSPSFNQRVICAHSPKPNFGNGGTVKLGSLLGAAVSQHIVEPICYLSLRSIMGPLALSPFFC